MNLKKNLTSTTCTFLGPSGIELDTINMVARLSPDKHQKAIQLVESALTKSSLSYEELQALLGFLSFAAKVVVPGRAFLRRLFNGLTVTKSRKQKIIYSMRQDLLWWKIFLPKWNGVRLLRKHEFRCSLHL